MRFLRLSAIVEAVTYLVLLAMVFDHRVLGGPNLTPVMGLVHGVLFLVYFAAMVIARARLDWSTRTTAYAIVAAVVPFGGFYVERNFLRATPTKSNGASLTA